MHASPILPEVCHRTRQHVSLRLDSELSDFEHALAEAHLARCEACAAFAYDLEAFTHTLRMSPLAEPSVPVRIERRPARFSLVHAGSAAAAAISVAAVLGVVIPSHLSPSRISAHELQVARERITIKERLAEAIDGSQTQPAVQTPAGLEAAEQTTISPQIPTYTSRATVPSSVSSPEALDSGR